MEIKNPILYLVNVLVLSLKDIVFFPVWWYTRGFLNLLLGLRDFLVDSEKSLAFFVWVKNIFTPMYGQRDIQGFFISVFIRVIQIIFRGISLFLLLILSILVILIWLALPVFILYQIFWQLSLTDFFQFE